MEDPGDFYWLTKADLLRAGNLQDASADNILKAIGKSKDKSPSDKEVELRSG